MPAEGIGNAGEAVPGAEGRPACRWGGAAVLCLFFAASFAYLWRRVDPSLLYHSYWSAGSFPVFRLTVPFLSDFLSRSGGLLGYVSAFLAQLYYADWSAALTVAAVATLLCAAAGAFLKSATGVRARVWHLVAGLLFMWPYIRCHNQLTAGLGVLAALLAAWAYAALPWRRGVARFGAFLVLALALYYVAGGFCALFAVMCGLLELLHRRRYVLGTACVACALAIPWGLGVRVGRLFWDEAYVHLVPARTEAKWVSWKAAVVLYAFCVLMVVVPPAVRALRRRRPFGAIARFGASRAGAACGALALVLCACAVFALTLDGPQRSRMRIDCLSQQERWEDVLQEARRLPVDCFDEYVLWDVNRALFHTGRLGDRLFYYPQKPRGLLPVTADFLPDTGAGSGSHRMAFMKSSRLLLDLGRINEAEQLGSEGMELQGRRPAFLKYLFLTNIVKRRTGVALKFLNLLAQDPIHRAWALRMRERVRTDPSLSQEPEVQRLRAAMGKRQNTVGMRNLETMLLEQLEADPHDRMALEYLMAHYLLTKQLGKFARWAGRLAEHGISHLPRHYQEAVLVYERVTGRPVDLGGLEIDEATRRRFFAFESSVARFGDDMQRASRAATEHMGTYFFYFAFYRMPES